ncbi:M14 family metallopeptidase [Bacillus suaedaesalsae]|uniref:X-prolyl-dipeptidyl aminopeptidase n=1 Tax=Bacillus suaedaesalsae TaxID=2810349 RepID=A0ABS2DJI5_9BACI|nr:M14 family zinc carboxypeptidase [Bacillus suaedaesalsae]MBM6618655.1 X-prolyl-dipeptidyl aminopeptidase [Bacillus suaedaesalsae]
MRKYLAVWLAALLLLSIAVPTSLPVEVNGEENNVVKLETSRSLFSLTEARTVEVSADFGDDVDLENLQWQFGGKSLNEWKSWNSSEGKFTGAPFIKVIQEPHFIEGTTTVKATLQFGLLFNTDNLSPRSLRTLYPQFIGNYELALLNSDNGAKAATTVKLNVYDEFLLFDEIKPAIDEVFEQAKSDDTNNRYLEYQSLGKSVEGRDLHFVILAKNKAAVDKYLNETLPTALENPESVLKKLENGSMGEYQVPIWINNIHPDEVEGVDAQVELLKKFALEEEVTFKTTGEDQQEKTVNLNVNDVLDDVIFLYMFTNNPDGRVANTRANANGFDLNRDNTYQTQVETRAVTEVIAKWTPLSFLDMHGYVNGFLIEPTTPPHNPNFEYDLLYPNMIDQAHSMGQAGIGNSNLDSYFIPALTWKDGWDDMTPAYTAIYAMLHGSLGHTIEVPALSQDSYRAMEGTGLGATLFVTENKDELYKKQLEIFKRGVNGEDNTAVDEYYINAAGEKIGRVRGENENFFPDYYVIPVDEVEQKNSLEAHKMVEYLLRNGVKVEQTTKSMKVDGTQFPKGTFVVSMNQAKRGFVNAVLYKGDNVSDWGAMYDPVVVNFPALRGFDVHDIREKGAFDKNTKKVEQVTIPTGNMVGNTPKQVLTNTNNETIILVNELLKNGKVVEVATETKGKVSKGDYIVRTKDLEPYKTKYYFEAAPLGTSNHVKTNQLKQPKVAALGTAQLKFSLKELGFKLVAQEEADVIVSDSSSLNPASLDGKSFVGIGINGLNAVKRSGLLPGYNFNYTRPGHEGLIKAEVNDHLLTSGYQKDELLYTTNGAWISSVPQEAEVLASFSDSENFYVSGWWPGNEKAKGQYMAFTQQLENTSITLFANDLAFRAHTQFSYRLLANSIFAGVVTEVPKKGKGKELTLEKKITKSKDEKGRNKITATVDVNALVAAAKSKDKVDFFTIAVEQGDVMEVQIPAHVINQLKNAQPNAKINVQTAQGSYVLPLGDIVLGGVSMDSTISITITVDEENYGKQKDSNELVYEVSHVHVSAIKGDKPVEITSFRTFTEIFE